MKGAPVFPFTRTVFHDFNCPWKHVLYHLWKRSSFWVSISIATWHGQLVLLLTRDCPIHKYALFGCWYTMGRLDKTVASMLSSTCHPNHHILLACPHGICLGLEEHLQWLLVQGFRTRIGVPQTVASSLVITEARQAPISVICDTEISRHIFNAAWIAPPSNVSSATYVYPLECMPMCKTTSIF